MNALEAHECYHAFTLSIIIASSCRKRRRLEDMEESKTVNKFADLIGRGQMTIAAAADIARNVVPMHSWKIFLFDVVSPKRKMQTQTRPGAHANPDPGL